MKKKHSLTILALVCALLCMLSLVACNGDKGQTVAVTNVTLNKTELTLEIDGTETLTATVTPDNATDKTVTWSSDKPEIASVDNTGKVTAKTAGTAVITAKAGDKSATCAVTVNAAIVVRTWKEMLESDDFKNVTVVITNRMTSEAQQYDESDSGSIEYADNAYRVEYDDYYYDPETGEDKPEKQIEFLEKDGDKLYAYVSIEDPASVIKAEVDKSTGRYSYQIDSLEVEYDSTGYLTMLGVEDSKKTAIENIANFDNGVTSGEKTVYTMSGDMKAIYLAMSGIPENALPSGFTANGTFKITVSNDKVVEIKLAIEIIYTVQSEEMKINATTTLTFSKYGSTTVTLPTVTE